MLFLSLLWLTGLLFVKAYPFSTNHNEEVALAFTSNLLSGMNFIPKERQIQVVKVLSLIALINKNLLKESNNRFRERRLNDFIEKEVFYVQLYKTIAIYQFIDILNQIDSELLYV